MANLMGTIALAAAGVLASTVVVTQVFDSGPVEATEGGSLSATVVKIVDGDTLDVRYDDEVHRVRLLNIDAPESKDPNRPVECLGQVASDFLEKQLPLGSAVTLEFDADLYDPYDRLLAGVIKDDVLVNAEIARAGLGVPVYFAPNDRFLPQVEAAHGDAQSEGLGLYDVDAECSIPAQMEKLKDLQEHLQNASPGEAATAAVIAAHLSDIETGRVDAAALVLLLNGDANVVPLAGYNAAEIQAMRTAAKDVDNDLAALQTEWTQRHAAAVIEEDKARAAEEAKKEAEQQAREKEEREAREKEEREAREKEEREAAQQAEQSRQEEQARRDQEERKRQEQERPQPQPAPAPPAPAPQPAPAPAPPPPSAPNPGAGYTGCRAYIGGPYVDDKGRFYTPIDCETKLPLVP